MTVFDFKWLLDFGHTFSAPMGKGVADVHGTNGVLPVDGLPAQARVRQVRSSLSRQLPGAQVHLSGSIPVYGFRPTHLPGELAQHRNLSASRRAQTLSCRHPRPRLPKHPGRCQRDERLAHLRRLRPRAHCQSQKTVRRRGLWSRLATDGLRAGFDNYRSVSFALPVGPI